MQMSRRESVLLLMTGAAVLFGVTYLVLRPKLDEFQEDRVKERRLTADIKDNRYWSSQRGQYEGLYEELRARLPRHGTDEKTDVIYASKMKRVADTHNFRILRNDVGRENSVGEIRELPIDCRDWEGDLEGMVRFLFDLQKEGAMFDIRLLYVKPRGDRVLKGRFSLYCAYTRD